MSRMTESAKEENQLSAIRGAAARQDDTNDLLYKILLELREMRKILDAIERFGG